MSKYRQLLRGMIPPGHEQERIQDLLDACSTLGNQDVLLYTSDYDQEISWRSIADARKYVENTLRPVAAAMRKHGIGFHLNVMQTLGHIYFPKSAEADFPFARRVDINGVPSGAGACPLCENLRQWLREIYTVYAELKPDTMWVDDDFRTIMDANQRTCFCPEHLKRFSEAAGRSVTLEEMKNALNEVDHYPPNPLRQIYTDVTTQGFAELAAILHDAVKTVSPSTQLGVMNAAWPSGTCGMDWDKILPALCGEDAPLCRAQCPTYAESGNIYTAMDFYVQDQFRAMLPANVIHYPELDCYPCSNFTKSSRTTLAQLYAQTISGFNNHLVEYFPFDHQRFGDIETAVPLIGKYKDYLKELHHEIPEGTRPQGIYPWLHHDSHIVNRLPWPAYHMMMREMPLLGFPIGYGDSQSPYLLLTGDDVLAATDSEIDTLLQRGAMMDVQALDALNIRGFGDRIGVKRGAPIPYDIIGYERFQKENGDYRAHTIRFFFTDSKGDWFYLIPTGTTQITIDSDIRNYNPEPVSPMLLLSENDNGERFAVFATNMDKCTPWLMLQRDRAEQLDRVWAWIARKSLPVAVKPTQAYLLCWLTQNSSREPIIGLINASNDHYTSVTLFIDAQYGIDQIEVLGIDGKWQEAPITDVSLKSDGRNEVVLTLDLGTMEFQTIRLNSRRNAIGNKI